jgi:methenyltetrahydromethanopterin cyclohydrolase
MFAGKYTKIINFYKKILYILLKAVDYMVSQSPSVNERAEILIQILMSKPNVLGIEIDHTKNGATLLDFTNASLEGGILYAKISMGDLAQVNAAPVKARITAQSGDIELEMLEVDTQFPVISCLGSQLAGWNIKIQKINDVGEKKTYFKSMASGPARAIARVEKELFEKINYFDKNKSATICLETRKKPDELVADYIAKKCGIQPSNLYILYAPTASLTGSIQIAARSVETAIHKLFEKKFDLTWLVTAKGICPIAPVAENDEKAMGFTNDCLIYTGNVTLIVDVNLDEQNAMLKIVKQCPSNQGQAWGKPFMKIFKEAKGDFYNIDPGLFAPARITIVNRVTGLIVTEGELNPEILDFT